MQQAARMPHPRLSNFTNFLSVCSLDCPIHSVAATRRMFSGLQFLSPLVNIGKRSGPGLFQSLNGVLVLDDLDGIGLCGAVRHELEGRLAAEVGERLAGSPADVDLLDVGC